MPDAAAGAGHAAGHGGAAAAGENYSREITFTGVAEGDTVKAYQLMKYDENYNKYIFHDGYKLLQLQQPNKLPEDVLKNTTKEGLTAMMANMSCRMVTHWR